MLPVPVQVATELTFNVPPKSSLSSAPLSDSPPLAFVIPPLSLPLFQVIAPLTSSVPLPPRMPPSVRLEAVEAVLVLTFRVPAPLSTVAPSVAPGPVRFTAPLVTFVVPTA